MISCHNAVTALSVNPVAPYQLAIGCSDSTVRIFDRRMLGSQSGKLIINALFKFFYYCFKKK